MVSALLPTLGQQLLGDKMGALAAGFGGGVLEMLPEPFATLDKMAAVSCPTLVMHGDKDEIVPIQQGIECHEKCASNQKVLKRWAQAGHNDIILHFDHEWSPLTQTADIDVFSTHAVERMFLCLQSRKKLLLINSCSYREINNFQKRVQ